MADFEVFCMGLFCGMIGTLMMIGAFAFVDSFIHKDKYRLPDDNGCDCNECCRKCDGVDRDNKGA